MWKKMSENKNLYLQKSLKSLNPRAIENCMNRAFSIDPEQLALHKRLLATLHTGNDQDSQTKEVKLAYGSMGISSLVNA